MGSQENPDIKLKFITKLFLDRLPLKMLSYPKNVSEGSEQGCDFDFVFLIMQTR